MRVRLVIALVGTAAAVAAIGLATSAEGQGHYPHFIPELSSFTPETVQAFPEFPLYTLGPQFDDLPLTAIVRTDQQSTLKAHGGFGIPDNRPNHVTFIYGSCEGCVPPLQVQIWPACDRTLQDYHWSDNIAGDGPSRPYDRVTIRGVPAAKFSDMLEIYSGAVTIVIFGQTAAQTERAAANLVSANVLAGNVSGGDPLPPPVAGAMEGKLDCNS